MQRWRGHWLLSAFCMGALALVGQVVFARELLVVFHGNELTIALVFAAWLGGVGVGAVAARPILSRAGYEGIRRRLWVLPLLAGLLLPCQMAAARTVRMWIETPIGAVPSFGVAGLCAFLILLPLTFAVGLFLPLVARIAVQDVPDSAGRASACAWIYIAESLGSLVAGFLLTWILLPLLSFVQLLVLSVGVGLACSASIAPGAWRRRCLGGVGVGCLLVVCWGGAFLSRLEWGAEEWRWHAAGVIPAGSGGAGNGPQLVGYLDTPYQSLAAVRASGQTVLYGNGQVLFVFPDPIAYELKVRFLMAQHPGAKEILLLGGNPLGEIPELLKLPIRRLVYVEQDAGIERLIRKVEPGLWNERMADPRVERVVTDPVAYVGTCVEKFDAILIVAPPPATAAANRYHTLEFFRSLAGLLRSNGFLATGLSSSEHLQSEAADLAASVYGTLRQVFSKVVVTAGSDNLFVCGGPASGVTLDGVMLARRATEGNLRGAHFVPEYFLAADEISTEKVEFVRTRLTSRDEPVNTMMRPAAFFHNLMLWGAYSDSVLPRMMMSAARLPAEFYWGVYVVLLAALGWVAAVRASGRCGAMLRPFSRNGALYVSGQQARWDSAAMTGVLLSTGCCGMAFQVLFVFFYQSLFGDLYRQMGLLTGCFMAGLVLGGVSGAGLSRQPIARNRVLLIGVEVGMVLFAVVLPLWTGAAVEWTGAGRAQLMWLVPLCMGLVGFAVGVEFPLGLRILAGVGGDAARRVWLVEAADHFGAAVGCLLTGALLVPLLGLAGAWYLLACVKILAVVAMLGCSSGEGGAQADSHKPGMA